MMLAAIVFGALGGLQGACGFGLWKLKSYGRTILLVFSLIGLLVVPVGTLISLFVVMYMFKPGIKLLFSEKPPALFTADERAQVVAISQGSWATAAAVAFVVLLGVAVLGIVAAIAIPGLLGEPRVPSGYSGGITGHVARADPISEGTTGGRLLASDARATILNSADAPIRNPIGASAIPVR